MRRGETPRNAPIFHGWWIVLVAFISHAVTAGISAGGIVFAPLAERLVTAFGWRAAFAVLGVLAAVIVLPPVMLFMRRDPSELGLLPDGLAAAAHASPADLALVEHEIERSIRPEVAFRQANFWLMAAAFSLTMAGLASVLLYQMPLLVDRGLPESAASLGLGATAAMGVVGKLGFGALLDRFDQRRVAAVCFCLQSAGVLLLWTTRSMPLLACHA